MNLELLTTLLTGSGITLLGVYATYRLHRRYEEHKQQEILKGVLQGIHDEIETLWSRYMEGIGSRIESLPAGEPLLWTYPITQDYFTVYTANAIMIGQINSPEIRKAIVVTYTKGRALIDSYRFNNDLIERYVHWATIHAQTGNLTHQSFEARSYQTLVEFADTLKRLHDDCKEQVARLLRMLEYTPGVAVPNR